MLNHALLSSRYELNEFTRAIKAQCDAQGGCQVRMRSGEWVSVRCRSFARAGGRVEVVFETAGRVYMWDADGSCVKGREYDLVELAEEAVNAV